MDDVFKLPQRHHLTKGQKIASLIVLVVVACVVILGSIRLFHRGRILPGASAYGIYLGGTTKEEATTLITKEASEYSADAKILINTKGSTPTSLAVKDIGVQFDPAKAVDQAYSLGRTGNIFQQLGDELGLFVGLTPMPDAPVAFQSAPIYTSIAASYKTDNTPVTDARIGFAPPVSTTVIPDIPGNRLNLSRFLNDLHDVLGRFDRTAITLQTYTLPAQATSASIAAERDALGLVVAQPLILKDSTKSWTISQSEILSWYGAPINAKTVEGSHLGDYYNLLPIHHASLALDESRIASSLTPISKQIDQQAVDAKLTIAGTRATVFQQSQDGRAVDTAASATAIHDQIIARNTKPVDLVVKLTKAQVTDDTIDKLGIHELLSEGVTYFPGSSKDRLTNVRVGQALYNNYLLKPDQIFSFGEILGPVGPEQGYKPGLVILADHEEKAYGGGLCQVSSTAFRAALLAGLPIVERVNHAFAVNFYTAPYGVPGIDATIYYPQVDFKFKNDTGSYILIQTEMVGTTLKFRYYGTKKKEGVIRGPNFISGSNDANAPSQTVFYRDVVVDGKVTKTDTFKTTYKSALDYPVAD
jgi:vancomycin resistance protein YoaR